MLVVEGLCGGVTPERESSPIQSSRESASNHIAAPKCNKSTLIVQWNTRKEPDPSALLFSRPGSEIIGMNNDDVGGRAEKLLVSPPFEFEGEPKIPGFPLRRLAW